MFSILALLLLVNCGGGISNSAPAAPQRGLIASEFKTGWENKDIIDANGNKNKQLYIASGKNWDNMVEKLLDQGADINHIDPLDKQTPLHVAIQNNHFTTASLLVKRKANVNIIDQRTYDGNQTPLMLALSLGNTSDIHQYVKLLLENDADPNINTFRTLRIPVQNYINSIEDNNPRGLNIFKSNIRQLVTNPFGDKKADINTKNPITGNHILSYTIALISYYNPISRAFYYQETATINLINLLIELGGDVKLINNNGNTPLHLLWKQADKNNAIHILKLSTPLLDALEIKNNNNQTPYDLIKNTEAGNIMKDALIMDSNCQK